MKKILSLIICCSLLLSAFASISVYAQNETLELKYDDRYSFEDGVTVNEVITNTVTSKKVSSDKAVDGCLDDAVITVDAADSSKIIASGIGNATLKLSNGSSVDVTVSPAKLSIFFLIGQSNAEGVDGKYAQSVANEDGTAYSTYGPNSAGAGKSISGQNFTEGLSVSSAPSLSPDSLTSNINVLGEPLDYSTNSLCDSGNGKAGLDSAIAYQWHRSTGEKCWIINAAHSGTSIKLWDVNGDKTNEYYQAVALFNSCKETAEKEYASGHYEFSHMSYIWMQGESDAYMDASEYSSRFITMHNSLKKDMTLTVNSKSVTAEYGAIIATRVGNLTPMYTFNDIVMNGPRIAQNYLANSVENKDIIMISNIGDEWVKKSPSVERPNLKNYFLKWYPDGILNYPTQSGTPNEVITDSEKIHPGYHYVQTGYNEIGFDVSRGFSYIWNYAVCQDEAYLKILQKDGHTEYTERTGIEYGKTIVAVPVLMPVWNSSSKIDIKVEGGLEEVNNYTYKVNSTGKITYTYLNGQTQTINIIGITYGDVNDDGRINSKDVLMLRKAMVGIVNSSFNELAADVVTNGKLTSSDVLNIRKYIARYPIKLGPTDD